MGLVGTSRFSDEMKERFKGPTLVSWAKNPYTQRRPEEPGADTPDPVADLDTYVDKNGDVRSRLGVDFGRLVAAGVLEHRAGWWAVLEPEGLTPQVLERIIDERIGPDGKRELLFYRMRGYAWTPDGPVLVLDTTLRNPRSGPPQGDSSTADSGDP